MPEQQPRLRRKSQLAREMIAAKLIDEIREKLERDYFDAWCRTDEPEELRSIKARADALADVINEFVKLATEAYLDERDNTATAAR